jgi:hypothetical protein
MFPAFRYVTLTGIIYVFSNLTYTRSAASVLDTKTAKVNIKTSIGYDSRHSSIHTPPPSSTLRSHTTEVKRHVRNVLEEASVLIKGDEQLPEAHHKTIEKKSAEMQLKESDSQSKPGTAAYIADESVGNTYAAMLVLLHIINDCAVLCCHPPCMASLSTASLFHLNGVNNLRSIQFYHCICSIQSLQIVGSSFSVILT